MLDARADLFAAGVILCEVLTGERPVHGDEMKMLRALARADFTPPARLRDPSVVPPALATVVERALAPDPDRRWSSADEMRAALLQALPHPDLDDAQRALGELVRAARKMPAPTGIASPDASTVRVLRDETTTHDRRRSS